MKKLILSAMTLAIVAGPALAVDNDGKKSKNKISKVRKFDREAVSLDYIDESHVNLQVRDTEKGRVGVTIFSKSGKRLFDENIAYRRSFNLPIDLSNQQQGNYKFVISGDDVHYEQEVFVSKLHLEDVHAEIDEVNEGIYSVKVLHDKVPVKISVSNADGRVFFSQVYNKKGNFEQQFDLRRIKGQDLEIIISGQKSYIRKSL